MNKIRLTLGCLLAVFFSGSAFSTSAQVATGTPPYGSYGGGPDVLNLANLNAHLTVPVLSKAGRGTPFTYNLIYDTSVWTPVTSGSTKTWLPDGNWGWGAETQVATGYLTATATIIDECGYYNTKGYWIHTGWVYEDSNWTYHDKFGVSHPFSGASTTSGVHCPAPTYLTSVATDGSGYTLQVQAGGTTVIARNGTIVTPQINSGTGSATKTDPNGNQISVSSTGVFTDTLGTTALTVSGGAPNPMLFTYTVPSGATAQYSMKYSTHTVQTNFACSGISEFSQTNVPLVSEIDLPDGTKYTFTYEPTYQNSPNVTGRLASVTLPAGGTISYSYGSGGVNGVTCADGSAATLTRTTPDGTWTYAHSETGTAWTTLITDPQNNQTNIYFQGIYETERLSYQGSSTLLKTLITCYNGNASSCNTTAITLPITQRTVTLQWPGTGGKQSKVNTVYSSFGLVMENDEYDYGSGAPGGLARQTLTTYASLGNNISNRPATIAVKDGSGNVKAQTTYSYSPTVTTTTGTPQHVAISGDRGNPTTISYLVQGSTTLSKTYTYYDTGTLQTTTDFNGATSTNTYGSGSCGNSFVTSVSMPLSLSASSGWNCTGGVQTSATDENGKSTAFTYNDPYFWRTTAVTDPASNINNFTYNGATSVESALVFNGGNSTLDVLKTVDGLGRNHLAQIKEGPSATTYDSVETDYDSVGRPSRTTLPYAGSAGQTSSSAPSTITTYDPLGRKTQVTDSGGRSITFTNSQNDVNKTAGPAPTGENAKRKQFEYDGLGRLTSVCEITSLVGSGNCGQTTVQTGYWTKYTYDVMGDLTGVTQNAQSGTTQTRSYTYDGLGRMTSETNPESGTTNYVFDMDSTCGTSQGDLVKRTDAGGNTICYVYDALHRNTSMTYSGPYAANTPSRYFVYDAATLNGTAMANAKTRIGEAYTCFSPCSSKITDEFFSYTVLGQVSDVYESTQHSSGYYHVTANYWANGLVDQLSGLSGLPTITNNLDGEGRIYAVSASSGQNPVTSTTYSVASKPTLLNLGSSDNDSFIYDPNTNRMTQYKFNMNSQSIVGNLGWNAIGTLSSLNVTDPFNSADTQSCSYSHDDLSRIASVNCGTAWAQTFSYDAFGNLNKSGTASFQATYSYLTNHMTQIGSSTPTYDSNGNVTNDFLHTYAWDANGRPITIDGVGLVYDAFARMVEQNRSGAYTQIVYSPKGAKLALMNGQSLTKAFVPLPAGSKAVYNSSGLAYYRHSDWVGSSRFASTPNRTMYFDAAYAPFGEPYAQAGTSDLSFTGMNQDTVPNLYDFPAREYGIQGRWPSPDPAGISSVRRKDPQTWNRYSYVRNQPTSLVDPNGECTAPPGGSGICVDLYIPTPTVPGSGGLGLGDNRGPQSDGGSFREQIMITYDPVNQTVVANVAAGMSEVGGAGLSIMGIQGSVDVNSWSATINPDGSATFNIDTTALNGWAGAPGAPSDPINLTLSATMNSDGTASINSGSTYSGYPSLTIFNYQDGQVTQTLANQNAGDISQLGTNETAIQSGPGVDRIVDSPIDGPNGAGGGMGDCACDNLIPATDANIIDQEDSRGRWQFANVICKFDEPLV